MKRDSLDSKKMSQSLYRPKPMTACAVELFLLSPIVLGEKSHPIELGICRKEITEAL